MNLNELLRHNDIDPERVLVFRHRPKQRKLRKVLPWLAAEKENIFNAYQQTQGPRVQKAMERIEGAGFIVSLIGHRAGQAVFVGLYSIDGSRLLDHREYWSINELMQLAVYDGPQFTGKNDDKIRFFDLKLTSFYASWKGKLVFDWPPPEISWWRLAHKNDIVVRAVHEESLLDAEMPKWDEINFTWEELQVLPSRWRSVLAQWRGVYFIFDESDGKGYVGSAYSKENLLGRWESYAATGHGGNRLLRKRDPNDFRFTILQRVSPDMEADDVIRLETSWKDRLHTRKPFGLNDN